MAELASEAKMSKRAITLMGPKPPTIEQILVNSPATHPDSVEAVANIIQCHGKLVTSVKFITPNGKSTIVVLPRDVVDNLSGRANSKVSMRQQSIAKPLSDANEVAEVRYLAPFKGT